MNLIIEIIGIYIFLYHFVIKKHNSHRKKKRFTSKAMTTAVNVTSTTMSRYEHGKITGISHEMIVRISKAQKVKPEDLIYDDPDYDYLNGTDKKKISSRKKEERTSQKLLLTIYGIAECCMPYLQ